MVKHGFDDDAYVNNAMHDMIAERDNLMTGMYNFKHQNH